jgi:hypothetical protein
MSQLKRHTFLNAATTASQAAIFPCDFRFEEIGNERSLFCNLSSAQVNVYLTTTDQETGASVRVLETTLSASTAGFVNGVGRYRLLGAVDFIELQKNGAGGTATVIGLV